MKSYKFMITTLIALFLIITGALAAEELTPPFMLVMHDPIDRRYIEKATIEYVVTIVGFVKSHENRRFSFVSR